MQSRVNNKIRGWIFDVYPKDIGEMAVWIISEDGKRISLKDGFQPKIYVSGTKTNQEKLVGQIYSLPDIADWGFVYKYAAPGDTQKTRVLEIVLKDCRKTVKFANHILKLGDYTHYEVNNCDLQGDRVYFFSHDLFPLASVDVESTNTGLKFTLHDSVESVDYSVPQLRILNIDVDIAKTGKITKLTDPIKSVSLKQAEHTIYLTHKEEAEKLIQLSKAIKKLDPDIVLTKGGDTYLFAYLLQRAIINDVSSELILSRDSVPLKHTTSRGRTFFSYGRTFYKAPTNRLYGRIHIDQTNTFILNQSSLQGLYEIARTCRVPLHTAARSSIGSSMSSIQCYQAFKNDILIPRNKSTPETFKTAYELLVADRGGFVYEPKVGIHDSIGEVDFSAMYPSLMVKNNISQETVLCKCCPDSKLRIPELNYHICEKRVGIVPQTLNIVLTKRLLYKKLNEETQNPKLKEIYNNRQNALKWILVTCFGYLGYRNSKFGTIDGHIGVCAFGRDTFLKAAHIAEKNGFEVIHGIVDSLWLKKQNTSIDDYRRICSQVSDKLGVTLNFEGKYKWIVFLPSKLHPNIGVLNRYYGVMENSKLKVRGVESRRRDTPRYIYDAQMDMINVFAQANNSKEFFERIPEALQVVKTYRKKLLEGNVPLSDLIITKRLSKNPRRYSQHVSQAIAADQLIVEGEDISAGKNISFLFTHPNSKRFERRVKAEPLIDKESNPDFDKYLFLLYTSAANLLSFCNYSVETIRDAVIGHKNTDLTQYFAFK